MAILSMGTGAAASRPAPFCTMVCLGRFPGGDNCGPKTTGLGGICWAICLISDDASVSVRAHIFACGNEACSLSIDFLQRLVRWPARDTFICAPLSLHAVRRVLCTVWSTHPTIIFCPEDLYWRHMILLRSRTNFSAGKSRILFN